ncbi:hypothetical protein [uncultured Brachyspira sp.]|uniref:hypothetical protein n=1 Tax=uncultured Brachyspira sp. TaxID=221953 RepID=UPI00261ED0E0|nr:hypothetical protein [uncultured Brachyspira sp.]
MIDKNYNYTEEEIINYVNGIKVSDEFINELEINTDLQREVSSLRNDIFIMENVKDSEMFNEEKKKSVINIKNNEVDYMLYFSRVTPLLSRGSNENEKYIYNNIEISKNGNEYHINIKDIKNWCIIDYNGEKIVNIIEQKDNYSMFLKKGKYNIKVDDYESSITVDE